jgi:imidazole glycerol phosphate synthase subunit HisF
MGADRVRVECVLQKDERLLHAIPVIASHAAQNAGIAEEAVQKFASDTLDVCREALACAERNDRESAVRFVVDRFQDRVEITIEYTGGRISLADRDRLDRQGADRVQHENTNGRSRVRFTKYCGALDSKQAE